MCFVDFFEYCVVVAAVAIVTAIVATDLIWMMPQRKQMISFIQLFERFRCAAAAAAAAVRGGKPKCF